MNRKVLTASLMAAGLLLIAQFNNCAANQADQASTGYEDLSSLSCTGASCVEPNESWLKLTANVNGEFRVHNKLAEFNIGGDCNEGAYPSNEVKWELIYQGSTVRTSSMNVANGAPSTSSCVNGKFMIYVNLAALTGAGQDTVNRTGLLTPNGQRGDYTLNVFIVSRDSLGGTHTNTLNALSNVSLKPLL